MKGGVPVAYCPVVRCTPEEGMGKVQRWRKALEAGRRMCDGVIRVYA
jgi:hypothetical protein